MSYLTIANALAAEVITITVEGGDDIPVSCLRLDEAKIPNSGEMPLRIQFPPGMSGSAVAGEPQWETNTEYNLRWQVVELMLLQPVAQGGGFDQSWPLLAGFVDAAMQHWLANRDIAGASIEKIDPRASIYEFPNGSGNHFHGVLTVLEVGVTCTTV